MDASLLADRQLWERLKQGDEAALTAIYRKYVVDLYNYGYRFGVGQTALEDSIQDLFLGLWKQREILSIPISTKYYLLSALKNQLLNNLKRRGHSDQRNQMFASLYLAKDSSPEERTIQHEAVAERSTRLRQAIDEQLTNRQREAIILFFYDGFTYDEVAELLAMSTKATYKLIYRALTVLQTSLSDVVFLCIIGVKLVNFLFWAVYF